MSDFFNEAYRRARSQYTPDQWLALAPQQVTEAIYRAMRELDAANAGTAEPAPAPPAEPADKDGSDPA